MGESQERYYRDDLEEFVSDHLYDEQLVRPYKKYKRLENIFDKIAVGAIIIAVFSIIAFIIIPIYTVIADVILAIVNTRGSRLPSVDIIGLIIADLEELFIIGSIAIAAVLFAWILNKMSEMFMNQRIESGFTDINLDYMRIAKAYQSIEDDEFEDFINYLKEYDGYYTHPIEQYVETATVTGDIDENYVSDTYEDFLGIFIERITGIGLDNPDELSTITDRYSCDYYIDENDTNILQDQPDTYAGIIKKVISESWSKLLSKATRIATARPLIVYIVFLGVGLALINFDPKVAVVVVTLLGGGFESWRNKHTRPAIQDEGPNQ